MRAALAGGHGVDLVHDHCARGLEHGAARVGAEQDVERLRRGHHDMRRKLSRALTLGLGRVAGPHPGADYDIGQSLRAKRLADAGERNVEIAVDIVRQGLEWRDIDDLRLVTEPSLETLAHQAVDGAMEGGERLAGAGWRSDQHVAADLDGGPGISLRGRRRGETLVKPRADRRGEEGGRHITQVSKGSDGVY